MLVPFVHARVGEAVRSLVISTFIPERLAKALYKCHLYFTLLTVKPTQVAKELSGKLPLNLFIFPDNICFSISDYLIGACIVPPSAEHFVFFFLIPSLVTGSIARSANLPVYSLLRGQF